MEDFPDTTPLPVKEESFNTGAGYFFRLDWLLSMCTASRMQKKPNDYYDYLESVHTEVDCKLDDKETIEADDIMILSKRVLDKCYNIYTKQLHTTLRTAERYLRKKIDKYGMLTPKITLEDPGTALRRGRGW